MGVYTEKISIQPGQSLSDAANCSANNAIRVVMPPLWTGGSKGVITFQISTDNVTFVDYFDWDGTEIQSVVVPNSVTRIRYPVGGKGTTWVKIRTGTREEPVVQKSKIDFTVVMET